MPTGRPLRLFAAALCGGLLLSGCANQLPQRSEHEERVERKLLEHTLQVDVGQPDVLELPQRRVRINDQKSFEVTEFEVTRRYDRYTPYQAWREIYELNLLDSPFAEQDISRISQIHLSVSDPQDGTRADASLRVSRSLRGKLLEAHALIYDDLEGDDVHHWVHRVKRLAELGLEEEASELEQSLIELTRNDPELQQQFMHALLRDAGRLAADPGETP